MAENVYLYLPSGADAKIPELVSGYTTVTEVRCYSDAKLEANAIADSAADGSLTVLAVTTENFLSAKLALLKLLTSKILRSSKVKAKIGDRISTYSNDYNVHTAVPSDGDVYISFDGLYSATAFKSGKGRIVLVPLDEARLIDALGAGAVKRVSMNEKHSKSKLAEEIASINASYKKIAISNSGSASMLMTVITSVGGSQEIFSLVDAETSADKTAADYIAQEAKSAKEAGMADYGVSISDISENGTVTICVADSDAAKVEVVYAVDGEKNKNLMAAAVVKLSEMLLDVTKNGISIPKKELNISKNALYIILGCIGVAFIACLIIGLMLFSDEGTEKTEKITELITDAVTEQSQVQLYLDSFGLGEKGEVSPFEDGEGGYAISDDGIVDGNYEDTTFYDANGFNGSAQGIYTTAPADYYITEAISETDADGNAVTAADRGTFVFTVYGWGHGVGMSQEGAIVYAQQGWKCNQILTHYYPGTVIRVDAKTPMYVSEPDDNGSGGMTLLEFLCKTVAKEIGPSSPYEALKAQAVAAYTYARAHNNFGAGQTMDPSFAYKGTNVEKAVMEVLNITAENQQPHANYVSTSNGSYANAVYYANCAGKGTSSSMVWGGSDISYLRGGFESPEEPQITTKEVTADRMESLIKAYAAENGFSVDLSGDPTTWITIVYHDGAVDSGTGYISTISVCGHTMSGNEFRSNLMNCELRSHCFTIQYVR